MALFNAPHNRKPAFLLALVASILAVAVVGLGAFTRLKHAGLGCPDWPGCYGHVWAPTETAEIAQANSIHPDMPVQLDKTWPEMVHRYFAGSLVVLTAAILFFAIKNRRKPGQPLKLPIFILAFIFLQAAFGMWTVTLKLWPQVVTAHLLGGFTMLSLLWLLTLRLNNSTWQFDDRDVGRIAALRPWTILGLIIVIMQITLGGWTTSNYAALACTEFPACHMQQWLPAMDLTSGFNIFQSVGPNYLGGIMDSTARIAIHVMHRVGALVTAIFTIGLSVRLFTLRLAETRRMAVILIAILLLQVTLGISNVVFGLPLVIAVAHNLTGAVLLLAFVTLNHRVFTSLPRFKS